MHQATHIAAGDDLGAVAQVVGEAVAAHFGAQFRLVHAEGAPEAAALICSIQCDQLDPLHQIQQVAVVAKVRAHPLGAVPEAQPPQSVATIMDAHLSREAGFELLHAQYVHHKIPQLEGALPYGLHRLGLLQHIVVVVDVVHATPRRTDDILVLPEGLHVVRVDRPRFLLHAAVRQGLSAAGLLPGVHHRTAQLPQQLQRRLPRPRVELIDVARNKKSNGHGQCVNASR